MGTKKNLGENLKQSLKTGQIGYKQMSKEELEVLLHYEIEQLERGSENVVEIRECADYLDKLYGTKQDESKQEDLYWMIQAEAAERARKDDSGNLEKEKRKWKRKKNGSRYKKRQFFTKSKVLAASAILGLAFAGAQAAGLTDIWFSTTSVQQVQNSYENKKHMSNDINSETNSQEVWYGGYSFRTDLVTVYKMGEDGRFHSQDVTDAKLLAELAEEIDFSAWMPVSLDEESSAESEYFIDFNNGTAVSLIFDNEVNQGSIGLGFWQKLDSNGLPISFGIGEAGDERERGPFMLDKDSVNILKQLIAQAQTLSEQQESGEITGEVNDKDEQGLEIESNSRYVKALTDEELAEVEELARDFYENDFPYRLFSLKIASDDHSLYENHHEYREGNIIVFQAETSHAGRGIYRNIAFARENASSEWKKINEGY